MKKIIFLSLVLIVMLTSTLSVAAAQTGTVTITPNTSTIYAGSSVTFTVKVTGVTAAKSIGIVPTYDNTIFELVSGEWLVTGAAMSDFSGGTATIAYASARAFNENVFKFTLKVKSNAKLGNATVNATVSIKNGNEAVTCNVTPGKVTVACKHSYSSWSSTNATTHTRKCNLCGNTENGSHSYTNACDTSCNTCGYTRTITHSYKSNWSTDASKHWHECSVCKAKKDETKHTPGAAATETTPQTCTTCGYVIKKALGHTHKPTENWLNDANSHWHACSTCTDKVNLANHTYDNACDTSCNVCGYTRSITHSYSTKWTSDKSGHWHVCTVCGVNDTVTPHTPGKEATEETPQLCTVCSYEIAPKKPHEHKYAGEWFNDTESHWQICKCGEKSTSAAHIWDEGKVTNEPTSDKNGEKIYTCQTCKYEKHVELELVVVEVTVIVTETVLPETTTSPEVTETSENTNTPDETTMPEITDTLDETKNPESTAATFSESGCGSVVGGGFLAFVIFGTTFFFIKKKL